MAHKMRKCICNFKLEILSIFIILSVYFFYYLYPQVFPDFIKKYDYFSQDRLDGIVTFFAITIGVYIAVITVLATSEIGISKEMLKKRLDKPLINVIVVGMTENFIATGLGIFAPANKLIERLLLIFIITSLISFAKFVVLLVIIFKKNMDQMAKSIDDDEEYRNQILHYLHSINNNFKK